MTGFEGRGLRIDSILDEFVCPQELRLFSHARASLAHFPPSIRNEHGEPSTIHPPVQNSSSLSGWWLLDGASIVPVLALGLAAGDSLLDMCAAPGGKSLLALQTKLLSIANSPPTVIPIQAVWCAMT